MLSWLKGVKGALFVPPSEAVQKRYAELVRNYEIGRPDADPRPRADGWVIALAQVEGAVVVTHQKAKPGAPKKRQIPDICSDLGPKCLRRHGFSWSFRACLARPNRRATRIDSMKSPPPNDRSHKAKAAAALRRRVRERLAERILRQPPPISPAPRYDAAFFEGLAWLDELAGSPR